MLATPSYYIGRTAADGLAYDLAIRSHSFQLSQRYAHDDIYRKVREELKAMPHPMTVTIVDLARPGLAVQFNARTSASMEFADGLLAVASNSGYMAHIKDVIGPGWSQLTAATEIKAEHRFARYTSGGFALPTFINGHPMLHPNMHLNDGDENMAYVRSLFFPKGFRTKGLAAHKSCPRVCVVIHVGIGAMDTIGMKVITLADRLREFGKGVAPQKQIDHAARLLKMMDTSPTFFRTRFIATSPALSRYTDAEIREKLQRGVTPGPTAPVAECNDLLLFNGARAFIYYIASTNIEARNPAAISILEHLVWADIYNQYVTAWGDVGTTIRTSDALSVIDQIDRALHAPTETAAETSELKQLHRFLSSLT